MADYDRGAYTPQTDAPLAFDARRPRERRPMPMALIGSAVVLVVLLGGVAMVYRSGVRHAGEAPRPVGEPVMSVKTAPQPEVAKAPPANLDVYNESASPAPAQTATAPAAAPAFTPP
ncbi:MAG: SPOR domain-containing protein, partial [Caulobacteraceae bacterium]